MRKYSTNYQFVDIAEVHAIHRAIINQAGTNAEVRDFALLHSAVERPKATYQGKWLYPTLFLKAAALLQSICLNHAFTDGNKRTAWLSCKRFLYLNNFSLNAPVSEAVKFMVIVDNKKPEVKMIAKWLKRYSIELR